MRTYIPRKLARDKTVSNMQDLGHTVEFRTLELTVYVKELNRKLLEEAHEAQVTNSTEVLKELGDGLEVVESLARVYGASFEELRNIQMECAERRGGFQPQVYIEKVTMADTDPWVTYYAAEPLKYSEADVAATTKVSEITK